MPDTVVAARRNVSSGPPSFSPSLPLRPARPRPGHMSEPGLTSPTTLPGAGTVVPLGGDRRRSSHPRRDSPGPAPRAEGGAATRGGGPGRAGRDGRGLRSGHRSGRRRRRTGLRLPLRPARLPDPAAAGRGRDRAGRPDRLSRPERARRGAGRHRVGGARRHPGPAVPLRGRHASAPAVRHRAGRAPGRVPPGRSRPDDRERARPLAGQGALRGGLVHPPAARAVAAVRRARRRGAGRAAGRARAGAGRPGQARLGAGGVRRTGRRAQARAAGRPLAAHLPAAQGPPSAPARRGPRTLAGP